MDPPGDESHTSRHLPDGTGPQTFTGPPKTITTDNKQSSQRIRGGQPDGDDDDEDDDDDDDAPDDDKDQGDDDPGKGQPGDDDDPSSDSSDDPSGGSSLSSHSSPLSSKKKKKKKNKKKNKKKRKPKQEFKQEHRQQQQQQPSLTPSQTAQLQAFEHLVFDLFQLSSNTHQLVKALVDQEYHFNVESIGLMTDYEIAHLTYRSNGVDTALSNASKAHLRVWRAYVYHQPITKQSVVDLDHIRLLSPEEYLNFRRQTYPVHYTNGPIPPSPADKYPPAKTTELDNWKRGIRRDPKLYPELKNNLAYSNWKLKFSAVASSQDLEDVLDPEYIPLTPEDRDVFKHKQKFLFTVFLETLLTDKGREITRSHAIDKDAQAVFKELDAFYTTTVVGRDKLTQLMQYITNARLGDGTWNGTTHAFILHYQEQIRLYNQYADPGERLTESLQESLLQNAVDKVAALSQVKATQQQLNMHRPGQKMSFDQYVQLLCTAALQLDKRTKTAGTTRNRGRTVYLTEQESEDYHIDTPVSDLLDSSYSHYDVNESVRVPTDRWSNMSEEGRKAWLAMPQVDRAALLGLAKPTTTPPRTNPRPPAGKPRPRSINLHQISAHDYLVALHEAQSSPTVELLEPDPGPDIADPNSTALVPTPTDVNQHEAVTEKTKNPPTTPDQLATVPGADLRRMLSVNQLTAMSQSPGGISPGTFTIGKETYKIIREGHKHEIIMYTISFHARIEGRGGLLDGGSNGGVGGIDMRVICFHNHRRIDITGINLHQVNDIRCATMGGVVNSSIGPIIIICHQYAYLGKGESIHSKGQLSYYGAKVDDNSAVLGGTQSITLAGGIVIPLDFVNGLPRMPTRPYTDKEWETLPHIPITMDKDWDPSVLDHRITDKETWYDAQEAPTDLPLPGFDIQGQPVIQEEYEANATYLDLQANLPDALGPLADYDPPPALLPPKYDSDDDTVSTQPSSVDPIEDHVDFIAYDQYLTEQHSFELDLMRSLEPEDTIEFVYSDAKQDASAPDTGEVLCFRSHTHPRLAFPTTRSQARAQKVGTRAQQDPQFPKEPIPPDPGELVPPDGELPHGEPPDGEPPDPAPPDGETPPGETPPGEPPNGEPPAVPPDPGEPHRRPPRSKSTAESARPPGRHSKPSKTNYTLLRPLFGWLKENIIQKTIENTTQLARLPHSELLKVHYKSPNPALNVPRRDEDLASDTFFSDTPAVDGGETMAQVYIGTKSHTYHAYGMHREKQFINTFKQCVLEHGAPKRLLTDRARAEDSTQVQLFLQLMLIGRWFSEAHKQFQNPMERGIQQLKLRVNVNIVLDRTGAPAYTWLLCLLYVCYLLNHTFNTTINGVPMTRLTGSTVDCSALLRFHFYEEVYYKLDDSKKFPSDSPEAIGYMVGISENVGHVLTYKVLTKDTKKVIHRSELRSTKSAHNKRLDFLSGEDLVGGQRIKTVIRSKEEDNSDTIYNESEGNQKPVAKLTDLIGKTFLMDKLEDGQQHRARITELLSGHEKDIDRHPERVKFKATMNNDQFEEILTYQQVLDHILKDETTEVVWKYKQIVGTQGPLKPSHPQYQGSKYNVLVEWEDGSTTSVPLSLLAADDPVACAIYAKENNLLEVDGWKRFKDIARRHKKYIRMVNQAKLRSYRSAPKYMFGYEVPRNYEHAVQLDLRNGNTKWQDCTKLEMQQLMAYDTFQDLGIASNTPIPIGYKKIRVHLVYAVKHDGRHKARLVADGHLTDVPLESVYSGVVSLKGFRLCVFLAELNGMETWATDIGNAYLEAKTKEKLVIVAGPEFGELKGHLLRIHKALYGLRTSGLRWHERFAAVLKELGFFQCKIEPDIWMRPHGNVYEYIAVYVDDLALVMKNPKGFVALLEQKYKFKFKGTGPIQYHLGMNFERDEDGTLRYIATKYIEKMVDSYERMFGEKPSRKATSPLNAGDHPELDQSEFLDEEGIQVYQSLIGSLQWIITIGRLDVQVAVMTLSSFRSAPRRGHLDRAKRVVGYIWQFQKACIRIRTGIPDFSMYPDPQYEWMNTIYEGAAEQLPHDAPPPLGKPVMTTTYVDANLMHDMLTGKSVTGVLHFVNQTPFEWYAKKQGTVETATYGSEMVAARTAVEQIIEHRTLLRYLGVPLYEKSYLFGDNESVVNGGSLPTAKINKRHNFLSFHRVREAIAAGYINFIHLNGKHNPADILSKHWGHQAVWPQLQPLMHFAGDTMKLLTPEFFKGR